MNMMLSNKNRRVLVIDDNPAIHNDFRKILSPPTAMAAASDATETAVFGSPAEAVQPSQFEVDSAYQGQEGVLLVRKALAAGRPYAMAFVDVRMPPGWDGVETTRKMWELDPDLQVVLCTAYSDYSWGEMFEKLGQCDGLLILKKPFDAVEALQLAHALTEKRWLHKQSRRKMEELESRVAERTAELATANETLQAELTERQRAEEALRRSETKFRTLYDSTSDAVMLLDQKGFFDCNPAALAMFGCATQEDFCSKHPADVSPPAQPDGTDSLTLANQHIGAAMEKGSHRFEWVHKRIGAGETFPAEVLLSAMELDGKPVLQGVVRDITERRRVEDQLRQLSRAVEQSPASIVITDAAGNIEYVNPKFIEVTGYTLAEVLGRNPRILKSGLTSPAAYLELWQTITAGKEWRGEFHNKKKNGELYWESASISTIRDLAGRTTHFVAVKEDITARKKADAQREFLIQNLEEALAKVKSLSGLLPICAWCKKIRDDQGYWSQVESYLQKHSEATFTHGMCPDCLKKFTPELAEAAPPDPMKTL